MPDGITHYYYYMKGYRVSIPLSLLLVVPDWKFAAGHLAGYSFHRYCDNDWDIQGVNNSESRAVNELPIIGLYIFGVSSAYGAAFRRRHRKWETHWPGISTIIRLAILFAIPFGYLDAYGINFIGDGWHMFWIGFWVGLSEADGIHYYLDLTDKKMKWAKRVQTALNKPKHKVLVALTTIKDWIVSILYVIVWKLLRRK